MSVAAAHSFNGCARRVHADCSTPANVRFVRMLLMSFVVVAVQLPQPAQAAVVRIPTDSWLLQKSGELDPLPAAGRQQQQQRKLLDIIERLLSYTYGTSNNDDDDDDYEWADDAVITVPEQLSSEWRQMLDDGGDVIKRSRPLRRYRQLKRGPGMCINSCLTGGMSFVRCKSMCH